MSKQMEIAEIFSNGLFYHFWGVPVSNKSSEFVADKKGGKSLKYNRTQYF